MTTVFERNSVNIIIPKFGTTTAEEVNSCVIRLKAKRLSIVAQDITDVHYMCYTMDGTGLLPEIQVIECTPRDDIKDESWYRLDLFDNSDLVGKNIYFHPNIYPLDLCQTIVLNAIPLAGAVDHEQALEGLDTDTIARIIAEKLPFISMSNKWWTDEGDNINTYNEWYCEWFSTDQQYLKTAFDLDPEAVQDMYVDNVQGFIEDNIKGVVLPSGCGQFGKYHINDKVANDQLNVDWKENVACYFPTEWSPPNDEDMDGDYLSYDHEWRTVSPQVRFLYADTNAGENCPKTDEYFRTWFIGS